MKNNKYFLNTALAIVLGVLLLAAVLVRTFLPAFILPKVNVPNVVLVSMIALLADHYVVKNAKRCYICIAVFSVLTFGLLPLAAGYVMGMEALKLAIVGGALFTLLTWLYTSMQDRLATGPARKLAPILTAVGLYLASQCMMGILL